MLGFGGFLLGSISLAFYLKDVSVPVNSLMASLPIMVFASTIMLLMASVWAMRLGDGVFAAVYGLFGTFWLSFFVLVRAIVIILLTLTPLRLPSVFTLLFVVVSATLLVLFGSIEQAIDQTVNNPLNTSDPWLIYVGITTMFLFIGVGMYIFASSMHRAAGAKNLPSASR
ncbi:hypothetical protein [Salinispora arenicola]|uniref:hypothetical protein n=1 Tax=Salinispora arenicola TaxID=168697 RepID=UPI002079E201|nr:hypothetical protein [Salinispora arenicola]MCN0154582.1 hypothetical protein [Salinispora arenicola]